MVINTWIALLASCSGGQEGAQAAAAKTATLWDLAGGIWFCVFPYYLGNLWTWFSLWIWEALLNLSPKVLGLPFTKGIQSKECRGHWSFPLCSCHAVFSALNAPICKCHSMSVMDEVVRIVVDGTHFHCFLVFTKTSGLEINNVQLLYF